MAKRRYDDNFRASAVLMLEAAGYPKVEGALARVSERLNVPHSTLSRWARKVSNPPPSNLVQLQKAEFVAQLRIIKGLATQQIIDRIEEYEPRDLTGLIKIVAEMDELLSGNPTERTEHINREALRDGLSRRFAALTDRSGQDSVSQHLN